MSRRCALIALLLGLTAATLAADPAAPAAAAAPAFPWWAWAALLFVVSLAIGVIAALGGVGGGVLFVPLVSSLFPANLDFVRAAGLLIALAGSLTASPFQLRRGYAYVKLMLPAGLVSSVGALVGAHVGLALPATVVQVALGCCVLGVAAVMVISRRSDYPAVEKPDPLSLALEIGGVYRERSTGEEVRWRVRNTPLGLALMLGVGFLAGLLGLGAGWANVPVFSLVMGAPLKVAAATSTFMISVANASAAWVYLNAGAVLPLIVVPSMLGMMAGSRIGVGLLSRFRPRAVRSVVVTLLVVSGARALLKGFGI